MIHVLMLLQVVFPTFDPPEIPASMGGVGHWVSIFLDLKNSRFQLLDSYYGPEDECAVRLFRRMTDNIKRLWKDASNDRETPFSPLTIDHFPLDWIDVPQQTNKYEFHFSLYHFCLIVVVHKLQRLLFFGFLFVLTLFFFLFDD